MSFCISRQRYHDDRDKLVVEITTLGKKQVGEDILPVRYHGESKNLISPLDAVRLAMSIIKKWNFNYWDEPKWIAIIHPDNTREYFDPEENKDMERLQRWADTINAQMTTCCHCKKLMGNREPYVSPDMANMSFCSEHCAATKYHDMFGVEGQNIIQKVKKTILTFLQPATMPTTPSNKTTIPAHPNIKKSGPNNSGRLKSKQPPNIGSSKQKSTNTKPVPNKDISVKSKPDKSIWDKDKTDIKYDPRI